MRAVTRDKPSPIVKRALLEWVIAQPIVGETKKARCAAYAAEQKRVRAALKKLKEAP
jgi:hypothetical protein